MASSLINIDKFGTNNYDSWKIQMKSVLRINDVWGYTSGDIKKTDGNKDTWVEKDGKALPFIDYISE